MFTLHPSPHSVHAIDAQVLQDILKNEEEPLSCHLAESEPEAEYFAEKAGSFTKLIKDRGLESPQTELGPIEAISSNALQKILVIHGNDRPLFRSREQPRRQKAV